MDAAAATGTRFPTNLGALTLDAPLNYGGTTTSYRARCGDRWVVLELVDEKSQLDDRSVADEVRRRVRAYAALLTSGVPVPRLLDHDVSRGYLVKEYPAGANVGETLARERLGTGVVDQFGALHYTSYEASMPVA